MSVNGNYIQAPLTFAEVAGLIDSNTNLASICKADGINKWAIYKPVRVNSISAITLSQRKSVNMGLQPVSVNKLYTANGLCTSTLAEIESQISEWNYLKPWGTSTSQCRISDFLNVEVGGQMQGYDHDAKPSDDGWNDCRQKGGGGVVYPSDIKFRINEETGANIGNADSHHMPLAYVIDTDNWYIGMAIYIPSREGWAICIGTISLGEATSSNIGQTLPNLDTNEWLKGLIGSAPTSLTCIPCLVKNPQTKQTSTYPSQTYIEVNPSGMSTQALYCMPSGAKHFVVRYNYPISNTSTTYTNVETGQTLTGYKLPSDITIYCGSSSVTAKFMLYGRDNYAAGTTMNGWFIAIHRTGTTTSGFELSEVIAIYAERNDEDGNYYAAKPSTSYSCSNTSYYSYTDAPSSGSAATTYYSYESINKTLSRYTTISIDGTTCYGATIVDSQPTMRFIASTTPGTKE